MTTSSGGAALACLRLHEALLHNGVNSKVLVLNNSTHIPGVIEYKRSSLKDRVIKSILYRINKGCGKYWRLHDVVRKNRDCYYSYPVSIYRVECHPLVRKWADVIHLHWCDDFVNYPTFFSKVSKPIVWTLHDISIGYGGFHYLSDYRDNISDYKQLEDLFLGIKRDSIQSCKNLSFILLSQQMKVFCDNIDYVKARQNIVLPNIIDCVTFTVSSRIECRKKLSIPQNIKMILFVCDQVENPNKGLGDLINALSNYRNTTIYAIGNTHSISTEKTKYVGKIIDPIILSYYYSAADVTVVPSKQESFSQTAIESMSCGTPVVAYPCGCLPQVINPTNGLICEEAVPNKLKDSIHKVLSTKYCRQTIRQQIVEGFSAESVAPRYLNFYHSVLSR